MIALTRTGEITLDEGDTLRRNLMFQRARVADRSAVTETAGCFRTSGFIDDTRASLAIPARHDANRRMDSAFLAGLVAEHRLAMDEALDTAHDLVVTCPRKAFKL